jgi:hypothetical protein
MPNKRHSGDKMIIHVTPAGAVEVRNPDDLSRLHCEIGLKNGGLEAARVSLHGIAELPSSQVAWLSVDRLRSMAEPCNKDSWLQQFRGMIDTAGAHGWLSPDGSTVRAHVVWLNAE